MSFGLVHWEKWEDPLLARSDERDDDDSHDNEVNRTRYGTALVNPQGILPFQERTCLSRYYNFWVGHTNFKLRIADVKRIKDVNGVEALNIPSPHRFRIAVGKAFNEDDVKHSVSELFYEPEPDLSPRSIAGILADSLAKKWKFWAVVRNVNGHLSSICTNRQDEMNQKLVQLEGTSEVICKNGNEDKQKECH